MTGAPRLSVVIPAFNEGQSIGPTLTALEIAIDNANLSDSVEIVLVDDGSTDGTREVAQNSGIQQLEVLSQPNRGRFEARRAGIERSVGENILLLDARVEVSPQSLKGWRDQVATHPERRAWCGAVETRRDGNPYAAFWDVLARMAWSGYQGELIGYGLSEFEKFPKGTGFFIVDRKPLLDALAERSKASGGPPLKVASDDTALLRAVIQRTGTFWISPLVGGIHTSSRRRFGAFLSNALYRGTTFIDSYAGVAGIWGNLVRFIPAAFAAGLVGVVVALAVGKAWAAASAAAVFALSACVPVYLASRRRNGVRMSVVVGLVTIPFGITFVFGMWRGWYYRLRPRS